MAKLTDQQLRAIFAAKRAGVTKRELFERDLAVSRFNNLPKFEQKAILDSVKRDPGGRVSIGVGAERTLVRIGMFKTGRPKKGDFEKAVAIQALERTKAKEAFIRESSIRSLSQQQLEEMR